MKNLRYIIYILSVYLLNINITYSQKYNIYDLKTCQLVNPMAVITPTFSWKIKAIDKEFIQSAYQIEVFTSEEVQEKSKVDIWNSGVVMSSAQFGIEMPIEKLNYGVKYFWRVRIKEKNNSFGEWSDSAYFYVGPSTKQWIADWITMDLNKSKSVPYFYKEIEVSEKKELLSSIVYLCGLGCSDLYVNGKIVEYERMLDPVQTNYEQYAFYSTFDITNILIKGKNTIGVLLGDGWYNQDKVWGNVCSYGQPILTLQMQMKYDDYTSKIFCTDSTWKWSNSPIIQSNIYVGEIYDARKKDCFITDKNNCFDAIKASGLLPKKLYPQLVEPIRIKKRITATSLFQDINGNWIFDFGVNIAGVPEITVSLPKGTYLKMRMGETLHKDSTIDFSTTGVEAKGFEQKDEYICSGNGIEYWSPRFTYHGFRYLELSDINFKPDTSWIKALVLHSDVKPHGYFKCSNENINLLHKMAVRSLEGNLHGVPTDCPQREKCGWLGDVHSMAPFANYNFDMYNFWMKYMDDIISTASTSVPNELHHKFSNTEFYHADKTAGIPYMIAPGRRLCGVASPDWGTAIVQLPWLLYSYYGLTEPIYKYYENMKKWVKHVESITNDYIVPYGLGDWCPPGGNDHIDCPIELSSTAFHYIDISIMKKAAELLGNLDDLSYYSHLEDNIKRAFNNRFLDYSTYDYGSQTANSLALCAGLVPEGIETSISNSIVKDIDQKHNGFLHTGIFGIGRIFYALARYGNVDVAYRLLSKTGENSFQFMWDNTKATTLWEILPINSKSRDFCLKSASSLNHPMHGSFDAWFYEDIAGIKPDILNVGFKSIIFEPRMTDYLQWAEGRIMSLYGEVFSSWRRSEIGLEWDIKIPPNANGLIVMPDTGIISVNDKNITLHKNIKPVAHKDRSYFFSSGEYKIIIHK